MERLVIGVPARNEATTIGGLAAALERGAAMLGEGVRSELVLAYQPGTDDTLPRWEGHDFRLPHRVLHAPDGVVGKGHNVKMLIRHALDRDAHLLIVDGDLGSYDPSTVSAFASSTRLARGGLVLPLWCRPHGQGNSTDFLACPVIFATLGAWVRHPLAGQRVMAGRMLASLAVDALPDDYGVDVALTWSALNSGLPVDQVRVPFPDHSPGTNSGQIMAEVAGTLLDLVRGSRRVARRDVTLAPGWWHGVARPAPLPRSLLDEDDVSFSPMGGNSGARALLQAPAGDILDFWCNHLARAIRQVRAGLGAEQLARQLIQPFLIHAEYRRRRPVDLDQSEEYVTTLGRRLAAALS